MASNLTRQWLLQQQKQPAVHKWEKRWVQKGKLMIFKWVKTDQKSGGSGGRLEEMQDDLGDGDGMEGMSGVQPRRLTRGKAADMGISVQSETLGDPEALTRVPPAQSRMKRDPLTDGTTPNFPSVVGTPYTPADPAAKIAEDLASQESRKRPRDADEAHEVEVPEEASHKKSRMEEGAASSDAMAAGLEQSTDGGTGDDQVLDASQGIAEGDAAIVQDEEGVIAEAGVSDASGQVQISSAPTEAPVEQEPAATE